MPVAGPAAKEREIVSATGLPRPIDLGSTQCIPCKRMAPILEGLSRDFAGALAVEVTEIRKNPDAAKAHGVRVIPTPVFLDRGGEEKLRHEGFLSRQDILIRWQILGLGLTASSEADES